MAEPAFLALWNGFAEVRTAEYSAWHLREHVPERVAAPGFCGARRYHAPGHAVHPWFTLYDVDGLEAFETAEYRDLLAHPTPWSASMRPDFLNFLRVPCGEVAAAGWGIGGALAVLRLPAEASPDVTALVAAPGMVAARLGRRAEGRAFRAGAEGSGAAEDFGAVLVLEALDLATATQAMAEAAARFAPGAAPESLGGAYALVSIFPDFRPGSRARHARPGWSAA
jgi:hypothetical protein